jgi:ribonuclease G
MSEEILINVTAKEIRIALLNNKKLQEIYIQRTEQQNVVGNIYKGRVTRLVPGMQAAFVDIGLSRSAFLHVSDLLGYDKQITPKKNIDDFLRLNQEVIVQVYKEALGAKGVRLTTKISLPARHLVLTPGLQSISISQKITDTEERIRLQNLLMTSEVGGYVLRTAAQGMTAEIVSAEQVFLNNLWQTICARAEGAKLGECIYQELPAVFRILRDISETKIEKIQIDDEALVNKMREFANSYMPCLTQRIEYYSASFPLFANYAIEEQIQKALHRTVYLKSGSYLVIDSTEAMTTIDVNSGSYLGHANASQMVLETNLEAAQAIAHQVRLRNIGGIIIIDFIDMAQEKQRQQLLQSFTKMVASDPMRIELSELSSLGLIQMTRKRVRESLEHILCEPCPSCHQRGSIQSIQTICYAIFREIQRQNCVFSWPGLLVCASSDVIAALQKEEAEGLAELELVLSKPIRLQAELSYSREQFNVLPT